MIGGKNKYLINGTNIQNNRVQDFFRSVQLNVNNPHFLIMQGRITQVINMKPPEILSLIEEACGTSIYCQRRKVAQETIKKKEIKIAETDRILEEDIKPQLEKLENDKKNYDHFVELGHKITEKERLETAFTYSEQLRVIEDKSQTKESLTEEINEYKRRVQKFTEDLERTREDLAQKIRAREESKQGQELKNSIKANNLAIEKLQIDIDELNKTVENFKQLKQSTEERIKKMEQEMEDTERKVVQTQSNLESTEQDLQRKKDVIKETEHKIRVLKEGGKVDDQATDLLKTKNAAETDL